MSCQKDNQVCFFTPVDQSDSRQAKALLTINSFGNNQFNQDVVLGNYEMSVVNN